MMENYEKYIKIKSVYFSYKKLYILILIKLKFSTYFNLQKNTKYDKIPRRYIYKVM